MRREIELKNEQDLSAIAPVIWSWFSHKIILFEGDLGAGKTTLIKSLLHHKNPAEKASSPSYSLINEYELDQAKLYHMDLYRLNDIDEALGIGIEDYLYGDHYVFIEWPELISDIIPDEHHRIKIEILESWSRKIIFIE